MQKNKRKVKLLGPDLKNRCANGDPHAIKEAVHTLRENAQGSLNSTRDDHRYHQGYLQAFEDMRDLLTKP